ncbi:hypothetical protein K461DRAFT_270922 [Myriangium duriaei CBS 260.36]|uniref:Uncharacterized protein n=1 Tax=Myriangium duriaei CBS 260.36 TaxID=1168546 RepID=A0A9P4ITC3_9PEZI|nr:hypothetical protein K461DRAFT_270922 [Myriangium duriaei CBS 260.36]
MTFVLDGQSGTGCTDVVIRAHAAKEFVEESMVDTATEVIVENTVENIAEVVSEVIVKVVVGGEMGASLDVVVVVDEDGTVLVNNRDFSVVGVMVDDFEVVDNVSFGVVVDFVLMSMCVGILLVNLSVAIEVEADDVEGEAVRTEMVRELVKLPLVDRLFEVVALEMFDLGIELVCIVVVDNVFAYLNSLRTTFSFLLLENTRAD